MFYHDALGNISKRLIIGTGNICLHNAFKDGSYGAKELALHAAKITSNGISGGITSEIFGGDFSTVWLGCSQCSI